MCIGLSEIMSSTSKDHVIVFSDSLIPTVSKALCDPLPEVREAAAKTFDNLHCNIGTRALDDILPGMLEKLVCFGGYLSTLLYFQSLVLSMIHALNLLSSVFQDDDEVSEYALDGLKQVMAVKSRVVLPYLVPQVSAQIQWRALLIHKNLLNIGGTRCNQTF